MRPSTECCLERRDMCARSAQGFVKNSGKTIQPWPRRMRRSRSTGTRLSVSSVSCWVVSISAGRRWRRIAPVAWGWKVTERSLVDRPPHCGRGLSMLAVLTRTQATAAVLRNAQLAERRGLHLVTGRVPRVSSQTKLEVSVAHTRRRCPSGSVATKV